MLIFGLLERRGNHCFPVGIGNIFVVVWPYFCEKECPFVFSIVYSVMLVLVSRLVWQLLDAEVRSHYLGMNYYVNFLEGLGSNEFHIK